MKKMTEQIDLRTPLQKARDEKHRSICDAYTELHTQNPECSHNRLCEVLGALFEMTPQGIKRVIINNGLYTPQKTTTA